MFFLLLICLGCVAQSAPPDLARKIEHHVRSYYNLPAEVKVSVGTITASTDMPGYDAVSVKLDGEGKRRILVPGFQRPEHACCE